MSSAILRSAALCIRANLFLQSGIYHGVEPHFDDLFGFSDMQFFGPKPKDQGPGDRLLASSPEVWFTQMQEAGITSLRLNQQMRNHPTIHDYKMAWSVDADKAWTLVSSNPNEPVFGYWGDESYLGEGKRAKLLGFGSPDLLMEHISPEASAEQFKKALNSASQFANVLSQTEYERVFSEAIAMIDGQSQATFLMNDASINYFELVAPKGLLPDLHINLLKAFEVYNIFGGAGSWNDLPLPNQEVVRDTYHIVSLNLHNAAVKSIVSVANAQLEASV
ncbi:MAG: hypothetical protein ABJG15_03190 [Hyphomonadaceae bacterium]